MRRSTPITNSPRSRFRTNAPGVKHAFPTFLPSPCERGVGGGGIELADLLGLYVARRGFWDAAPLASPLPTGGEGPGVRGSPSWRGNTPGPDPVELFGAASVFYLIGKTTDKRDTWREPSRRRQIADCEAFWKALRIVTNTTGKKLTRTSPWKDFSSSPRGQRTVRRRLAHLEAARLHCCSNRLRWLDIHIDVG